MSPPAPSADPDDPAVASNETLAAEAPAVWASLSPLGRRLLQPANFLPQQTADARGTTWNGTIGQITDGHGRPLPLAPIADALSRLSDEAGDRALLYSPVEGFADVRAAWRAVQRQGIGDEVPSSLPIATSGRELAIAAAAQLFLDEGRTAIVVAREPEAFAGLVAWRTGARFVPVPLATEEGLEESDLAAALANAPAGEPAWLLISGGRFEPMALGRLLARALGDAARPIVVVFDVGEAGDRAPFFALTGAGGAIVPLLVDGPDASIPGAGLAFLTLPFAPASRVARALEAKIKTLLRASVGSPPSLGQMLLLAALVA